MSLLDNYKLRKRLEKLESLAYEKTSWRGEPSKAYLLWKYLMDNGPQTVSNVQSEFPPKISSNTAINFFASNDLIYRNGNTLSANPDYNWEDVGVIPRTAQQETISDMMSGSRDVEDEAPVQTRAPIARRRAVKANIFSKKVEEVQAAIDEGVDVNTTDNRDRTPLMVACMARNGDTGAVIKLLLDNGANPNDDYNTKPAVLYTVKYNNKEGTLALANAGADLAIVGDSAALMVNIINSKLFSANEIVSMITEDFMRKYIEKDFFIRPMISSGCSNLDNPNLFLDKLISTTLKVTNKPTVICNGLSVNVNSPYWFIVADALERNGRAIYISGDDDYVISMVVEQRKVANKVYDLAEKIGNGVLKTGSLTGYCRAVIGVCNKYNKSVNVLENLLKQDVFNDFSPYYQWEILSLATDDERENEVVSDTLIRCLNKLKFKKPTPDMLYNVIYNCSEIGNLDMNGEIPSSITRLVCKKIKPYARIINDIGITRIAGMRDRLFIEEMIDAGLGEDLAACWALSNVCKQELEKAGIPNIGKPRNSLSGNGLINRIIYHIYNDTMDQSTRQVINEDPEILSNEIIQDALNDPSNEDSVTAAQLKRQYDQWLASGEKPKYDM